MSNTLAIIINLPEDFLKLLQKEIADELTISQKKWKITLDTKEKTTIKKAALTQLASKVSSLAHSNWDLGDKLLINATGASGQIELPKEFKDNESLSLILNKKGWEVIDEEAEIAVSIGDFYDETIGQLYTWVRTAVFYGVGSFSSR